MSANNQKTIIAVVGANRSGKSTASQAFADHFGCQVHEISSILRIEAEARGLPPERDHLRRIWNELVEKYGSSYLLERTLDRIEKIGVIAGSRHVDHIAYLGRHSRAAIIGIVAPEERRFQYAQLAQKPGDVPLTLQQFREDDQRDQSSPSMSPIHALLNVAMIAVANEWTLAEYLLQIKQVALWLEEEWFQPEHQKLIRP